MIIVRRNKIQIALITDQHFGARNDSDVFQDYFQKFYEELFFPYLKNNNIKNIFCLGDTLDRRKYVNFKTLDSFINCFIEPIREKDLNCQMIVGNHDTYWKNTNNLNSPEALVFPTRHFKIYAGPEEIFLDGKKVLIVPWITKENSKKSFQMIKDTKAKIVLGHLEIAGFSMYKNYASHGGLDKNMFSKFDFTASGHFHHKSDQNNIHYLGAPYQMNWNDHDDPRGFHIFDTDTLDLKFIENPFIMFEKIYYDEGKENIIGDVRDKYVRLVVLSKQDNQKFELYLDELYKKNPIDVDIHEDFSKLGVDIEDEVDFDQDTVTFLEDYVDCMEDYKIPERAVIKKLIQEIYIESINK